MIISTPQEWNQHVIRLKAELRALGVQIKTKNLQKVSAQLVGYPHENAVYAALPLDLAVDELAGERLHQLLAVMHQQVIAAEEAQKAVAKACAQDGDIPPLAASQ